MNINYNEPETLKAYKGFIWEHKTYTLIEITIIASTLFEAQQFWREKIGKGYTSLYYCHFFKGPKIRGALIKTATYISKPYLLPKLRNLQIREANYDLFYPLKSLKGQL